MWHVLSPFLFSLIYPLLSEFFRFLFFSFFCQLFFQKIPSDHIQISGAEPVSNNFFSWCACHYCGDHRCLDVSLVVRVYTFIVWKKIISDLLYLVGWASLSQLFASFLTPFDAARTERSGDFSWRFADRQTQFGYWPLFISSHFPLRWLVCLIFCR